MDAPGLADGLFLDLVPRDAEPIREIPERKVARRVSPADPVIVDVSWEGLEAGTYELRILTLGGIASLLAFVGLRVPKGATCEDPRLASVDLRGLLRAVELRFVDEANAPIRPHYQSCSLGAPREIEFPTDEAGELHLRALFFVDDEVEDFHGFGPEQIGPAEGRGGPVPIEVDAAALTRASAEMAR